MSLANVTFDKNSALTDSDTDNSGSGGAIYYTCGQNMLCNMFFSGRNNFTNNRAENAGGAVKWTDLEPLNIMDTSTFYNNSAILFGDDIASFPQKIVGINSTVYE